MRNTAMGIAFGAAFGVAIGAFFAVKRGKEPKGRGMKDER